MFSQHHHNITAQPENIDSHKDWTCRHCKKIRHLSDVDPPCSFPHKCIAIRWPAIHSAIFHPELPAPNTCVQARTTTPTLFGSKQAYGKILKQLCMHADGRNFVLDRCASPLPDYAQSQLLHARCLRTSISPVDQTPNPRESEN